MLFITNHKIRQPIANCLGLLKVIDFNNPSREEINKIHNHFNTTSTNCEKFSRELAEFIYKIGQSHEDINLKSQPLDLPKDSKQITH